MVFLCRATQTNASELFHVHGQHRQRGRGAGEGVSASAVTLLCWFIFSPAFKPPLPSCPNPSSSPASSPASTPPPPLLLAFIDRASAHHQRALCVFVVPYTAATRRISRLFSRSLTQPASQSQRAQEQKRNAQRRSPTRGARITRRNELRGRLCACHSCGCCRVTFAINGLTSVNISLTPPPSLPLSLLGLMLPCTFTHTHTLADRRRTTLSPTLLPSFVFSLF